MRTRTVSLLFAILLCTAFQCEDNDAPLDEENQKECFFEGLKPAWVDDVTDAIEANGWQGEVVRYWYHDEYVFLIDGCHECPDFMTSVYSCNHEIRCSFGGIAGVNTCPDFGDEATGAKIIWRNY